MHLKRPAPGLPWALYILTRIALLVVVGITAFYCISNITKLPVPSQLTQTSTPFKFPNYFSAVWESEKNITAPPSLTESLLPVHDETQWNIQPSEQPLLAQNDAGGAQGSLALSTGSNASPQGLPVPDMNPDTGPALSLEKQTPPALPSTHAAPAPVHSSPTVPTTAASENETKANENNSTEVKGGRCGDATVANGTVENDDYSVTGYPFEVQRRFPKLSTLTREMGDIGPSAYRCEGNHTCVWTNLCVDHTKNDTLFTVNNIHFPTFHFKSKGVWYNVSVTTRPTMNELEKIMYINGTTHMFNVDFGNWFFTILKTFSLRRTIDLFTGRDAHFNLMLFQKSSFVSDLAMPYFQMYRTIHPTFNPVYYLKTSVNRNKANITCFERAVFGYEYMGQPLTGFTGKHLEEALPGIREEMKTDPDPVVRDRNKRLLEMHDILGPELRAYRKYSLTQMGKYNVPMERKLAVLVARNEGRSCTQQPYRVILNQDDLIRVLEEEGYTVKVVDFAGMSAPEQIEVSRQANLFIAVHGAGVANIFWMHQTACVLELHTYGFQKWGYETFANYLKLPYVGWVNQKEEHTNVTWHSQRFPESDTYLVLFNDDSEKDYFVRFSIRPNIYSTVAKTKTQIMFKIPKGIRGTLQLFMKVPSDGERDHWMSALQRVCPTGSVQSLTPSSSMGSPQSSKLVPGRLPSRLPTHQRSRSVSSAPLPSPKVVGAPAMLTPPATATNIRRSMSNLSAVLDHPENDGSLFCSQSHSKCVQAAEQLQSALKGKDPQLQGLADALIEALALYSSEVNIESQRLKDEIRGLKDVSGTLNQTVVEMGQQMHRLEKLGFRMSRYGSKARPGAGDIESPEGSENDEEFFDAVDAQVVSRRTSLRSLTRAPTVNLMEQIAREPATFRVELPSDKSDRKLSVWKFLKDSIGKDFSKISMPIVLNEPISAVQRVCEDLEPAFLLTQAASCQDPNERLLYIAIFAIAAYKNTSRTGKPFNPLLGETFELDLTNVNGYEYRAVAEQVSHHPPVTAVHAHGKGWKWWKQVDIKNKFRGKSMEVYPTGSIHVLIGDEHYTWDCVTSVVNNLVVGTLWVDQAEEMRLTGHMQYGPMTIKNHKTGACAKLNFKAYSYFGSSEVGAVEGVVCDATGKEVYQIEGNCHDFARARLMDSPNANFVEYWVKQPLPPKSATQFNFSTFTMLLNQMMEEYVGVIAPSDSRYRPDLRIYEEGDLDKAQDEKTRLEEKQRAVRRAREAKGEEWTPLWFEEGKDQDLGTVCWRLSEGSDYWAHRSKKDWTGCPDLY